MGSYLSSKIKQEYKVIPMDMPVLPPLPNKIDIMNVEKVKVEEYKIEHILNNNVNNVNNIK